MSSSKHEHFSTDACKSSGQSRRSLRSAQGESMVQTALVLPVIVLLIFSIMELGRFVSAQVIVNNAAREGARAAALRMNVGQVTAKVQAASPTLDAAELTVVVTNAQGARGQSVSVQVSYPVDLVVPLVEDLLGGAALPVSAQASMRLE